MTGPQPEAVRGDDPAHGLAPMLAVAWRWYGSLTFWGRFWVAVAILTPLVWGVTAIVAGHK